MGLVRARKPLFSMTWWGQVWQGNGNASFPKLNLANFPRLGRAKFGKFPRLGGAKSGKGFKSECLACPSPCRCRPHPPLKQMPFSGLPLYFKWLLCFLLSVSSASIPEEVMKQSHHITCHCSLVFPAFCVRRVCAWRGSLERSHPVAIP